MYVYTVSFGGHRRYRSPAAGVTSSGCWDLNLGPLEKQEMLLATKSFLTLSKIMLKLIHWKCIKLNKISENSPI